MCQVKVPFGVELEFSQRRTTYESLWAQLETICANHGSTLRTAEGLDSWTLKHDCSCGYELTTPRLVGPDGLDHLCHVAKDLQHENSGNNLVDRSCGLHVHLDINDLTRANLQNIFVTFQRLEGLILQIVPPSRSDNNYCRRISDWSSYRGVIDLPMDHANGVNFMGWNYRGDMEIRYGAGTCDHSKLRHWVLFLQGVVYRATEVDAPAETVVHPDQLVSWMGDEECDTLAWVRNRWQNFRRR